MNSQLNRVYNFCKEYHAIFLGDESGISVELVNSNTPHVRIYDRPSGLGLMVNCEAIFFGDKNGRRHKKLADYSDINSVSTYLDTVALSISDFHATYSSENRRQKRMRSLRPRK